MTSTARSVVLGVYTGLPARFIEPFARSLRAVGFEGQFVVFAGRCGEQEMGRLRAVADAVIDVDRDYPRPPAPVLGLLGFLRSTRGFRRLYPIVFSAIARLGSGCGSSSWWSRLEYHLEGLQSLRFVHYRRYLEQLEPSPDWILLTDLRDVVFQGDPFTTPPAELELYLEDDSVRIGADKFNARWISDLYGHAKLERLRDRPVSCSGTVVGTPAGLLRYLELMGSEVVRYRRPMGSHDQGVHNALLYGGRLSFAAVFPNGTGRVLTLGKMQSYVLTADGTVLNADGGVPSVLHQWDRHAELVELVSRA